MNAKLNKLFDDERISRKKKLMKMTQTGWWVDNLQEKEEKKKWKGRTMNIDSSYLCCRSFLHSCNLISCKKATTKIIKSSPLCASSLFETKRPCSKYLHPQQRIIKSKLSIFPLPTSMQLCRSPLLKSRKWRQNGGSIVRLKGINWRKGGSKKKGSMERLKKKQIV